MTSEALTGKTALVTGAGKRLGRAIALALADEGVNVVAHYNTSAEEATALCREVEARGVRCWPVKADFSAGEYDSLIARALELTGRLDLLVNNASVFHPNTLPDVTFPEVVRDIEINAWAPLVLARAFAQATAQGKIVNLLDTRIVGDDAEHVSYILGKHALAALTRMMAVEFAPGVAVNAVAPGLILPPAGQDETYLAALADTVPLQRHGGPDDIAQAALFLLKSTFITGQVIFVDGGRHLREYPHG